MKALLLVFASIFFDPIIVEDHFDLVEINTIRQDDGSVRLKQYVWWDSDRGVQIAQGWCDFRHVGKMPVRVGNHYEIVWWDGKLCRKVTCRAFFVTETQDRDPEVENRQLVPMTHRRGLSDP